MQRRIQFELNTYNNTYVTANVTFSFLFVAATTDSCCSLQSDLNQRAIEAGQAAASTKKILGMPFPTNILTLQ